MASHGKKAMKEEKKHVKITKKNQQRRGEKKRTDNSADFQKYTAREKRAMRETREKFGCVSSALVEDLAAETIGSICIHVRPFHHVPLVVI